MMQYLNAYAYTTVCEEDCFLDESNYKTYMRNIAGWKVYADNTAL